MRESQRPRRQDRQDTNRAINRFFGFLIPIALLGTSGYSIWVVVIAACANYLLKATNHPKRPRTAIAILVVFFILLTPWLLCYLRILLTVPTNPGYVTQNHASGSNRTRSRGGENLGNANGQAIQDGRITRRAILDGRVPPPPGIEYFYSKDIFVCDDAGLPIFCETCRNWKPDRTHHCSEVNRCVRRMDHFCPWIGGVVSETNMKFFMQMVAYGLLFSAFIFGVFVWLCVDQYRKLHTLNGNFIALAALGGSFSFISLGMTLNSVHLALKNMTTVENLGRQYFLAVHISDPAQHGVEVGDGVATRPLPYFHTITYPIPPRKSSSSSPNTPPSDSPDPEAIVSSASLRTFAIIPTKPGDNPWNIGWLDNLKSILGERYLDWILPIRYSPCCSHDSPESDYPLGPDVERLKREYGLDSGRSPSGDRRRKKARRRYSHSHRHHHRRRHSHLHPNASPEARHQDR